MIPTLHRFIEEIGSSFIKRRRENNARQTDHSDPFIISALKSNNNPQTYYNTNHIGYNFLLNKEGNLGSSVKRDIILSFIDINPEFYYPRYRDFENTKKCTTNPLVIIRKLGNKPNIAFILLNPWGVGKSIKTDYQLGINLARKYNIDVILSTLPLHRNRSPVPFESGELALNGNIGDCLRSFKQAVEENILIKRILRKTYGYEYIGIGGVSLGGIIASVSSSIAKYDFCVQLYSSGKLADIIWQSDRLGYLKRHFIISNITKELLREYWKVIDPISFLKMARTKSILAVNGVADGVIPFAIASDYLGNLKSRVDINLFSIKNDYSHYTGIMLLPFLYKQVGDFVLSSCR